MQREGSRVILLVQFFFHAARFADDATENATNAAMVEGTGVGADSAQQHLPFALGIADFPAEALLQSSQVEGKRGALVEDSDEFGVETIDLFAAPANIFGTHLFLLRQKAKAARLTRGS